jgi:4-aminobutyrate aminotransferase-like enzyme
MPHLMNTYGRLPVAFTHGEGCRLFDEQGKSYLDALAELPSIPWATIIRVWCRHLPRRSGA